MNVHIIRVDGTEEYVEIERREIAERIGADYCDGFSLRDGRYVIVDDEGMTSGRQVNAKATALYHGICHPGTVHPICGDVAIIVESGR